MKSRAVGIIAVVLLILLLAGVLAVYQTQPLMPGASGYGIQQAITNFITTLIPSPVMRADRLITLAGTRLEDYQARFDTAHELASLLELDAAFRRAVIGVAELEGDDRDRLEADLQELAAQILDVLGSINEGNPATATMRDAVRQRILALLAQLESGEQIVSAGPSGSEPVIPLDVPFPVGSLQNHPFPLDGAHATLNCENCHTGESYEALTLVNGCVDCHTDPHEARYGIACERCHNTTAWTQVRMDHTGFTDCLACHAPDAPANHYAGQCSACHNTVDWVQAVMNHTGFTDCLACHAPDAPANHYPGQCSACHNTVAWPQVSMNHSGLADCAACHAPDAPANHYPGQCSACHGTSAWLPAQFDHSGFTDCVSCHASRAPANHYAGQCSTCHSTSAWRPAQFNHSGLTDCVSCHASRAPANHYPGQCSACHSTSAWRPAQFNHSGLTDCVSCHSGDAPRNHFPAQCSACHSSTKWGDPQVNHTGLTDCMACHLRDRPDQHDPGQCSNCHTTNKWGN
jgi:hypothetical protein